MEQLGSLKIRKIVNNILAKIVGNILGKMLLKIVGQLLMEILGKILVKILEKSSRIKQQGLFYFPPQIGII